MSKSDDDECRPDSPPVVTELHASLMGWTNRQGHILTGGGSSSKCYRPPRFPFTEQELPHYHLTGGTTHDAFAEWHRQETGLGAAIAGTWRRPLFVGGWTHSDDVSQDGETVFNLQTPTFFLDMRVPKAGTALLGHHGGFETMTDLELRLFARRHAFAGYTRVQAVLHPDSNDNSGGVSVGGTGGMMSGLVATRHHAIDWNYVGQPRPRPNKWRVEMGPGGDVWKEWGFAKDDSDQHVYMERWERLPGGRGPYLALRRRPSASRSSAPDALVIVCGDHFGLVVDRSPELLERRAGGRGSGGLVGLVDEAVAHGDRLEAVEFLSMEASHGRIKGREGRRPFLGTVMTIPRGGASVSITRETHALSSKAKVSAGMRRHWKTVDGTGQKERHRGDPYGWKGAPLDGVWDVMESTLSEGSPDALRGLLESSGAKGGRGVHSLPCTSESSNATLQRLEHRLIEADVNWRIESTVNSVATIALKNALLGQFGLTASIRSQAVEFTLADEPQAICLPPRSARAAGLATCVERCERRPFGQQKVIHRLLEFVEYLVMGAYGLAHGVGICRQIPILSTIQAGVSLVKADIINSSTVTRRLIQHAIGTLPLSEKPGMASKRNRHQRTTQRERQTVPDDSGLRHAYNDGFEAGLAYGQHVRQRTLTDEAARARDDAEQG